MLFVKCVWWLPVGTNKQRLDQEAETLAFSPSVLGIFLLYPRILISTVFFNNSFLNTCDSCTRKTIMSIICFCSSFTLICYKYPLISPKLTDLPAFFSGFGNTEFSLTKIFFGQSVHQTQGMRRFFLLTPAQIPPFNVGRFIP